MDPHIPMLYRLKVNMALADGYDDDWHLAEAFRKEAEEMYSDIRATSPVGDTRWPAQERELVNPHKFLDSLAQDQLANRPQSEEDLELPELPSTVLASQAGDGDSRLPGSSEPTILHSHGSTEVGSAPNPLSSRDTMRDVSDAAHADDMDISRTSVASYNSVPHRPFADPQPAFPRRCSHDNEGLTESPSKKRKGDKK
jgi:hypothetical protein